MSVTSSNADPLDEVREVLATCGFGANADRFITCHDITTFDDLDIWDPEDSKTAIKMYNDRYGTTQNSFLGFTIQVKLQGLLFWIKDETRRQRVPDTTEFTQRVLQQAIQNYKITRDAKDADTATIEVGKVKTDLDWFDWAESFESLCDTKMGVDNVPISYVIRRAKPADWEPDMALTENEKLKYQVALDGNAYAKDNEVVWSLLHNCCVGTAVYDWIREYGDTKDGRSAWMALVAKCEGDESANKRLSVANNIISTDTTKGGGAHWANEHTYTFDKYSTNLHKAFRIIQKYRNTTAPETMVQRLLDGMRNEDTEMKIAKRHVRDNLMGDWHRAVNYLSTVVSELYPNAGTRQGKRKALSHARRVSKAARGGGRGGRDGRGGRGGRYGRGGRGGRNEGPRRRDFINGIDVRDVWYNFSDNEFSNEEVRTYVFQMRNHLDPRINGRGGGRGRGGRGGRHGHYGGRGGRHNENDDNHQRRVEQAESERNHDRDANGNDRAMVPYSGDNNNNNHTSEEMRAAQGRGGRAGARFGRGAYHN